MKIKLSIYFAHSAKISYYLVTSIFLGVYLIAIVAPDNMLLYLFPKFAGRLIKEHLTQNTTISIFLLGFCLWNIHIGIFELLNSIEEIKKKEITKKRLKAFISIAFLVIACFLIKYELLLYFFLFFAFYFLYKQVGNRSLLPPFLASLAWFLASIILDFLTDFTTNNVITGAAFLFLQLSFWIHLVLFFALYLLQYTDEA